MKNHNKEADIIRNNKIVLILLADWYLSCEKFWLQQYLEEEGFTVKVLGLPNSYKRNLTVRWRKLILWCQYFILGKQGAKLAKKLNGKIVAMNYISGVFAALFMPKGSRRVIGLNMIAHEKGFINQVLRKLLYDYCFSTDRMIVTVVAEDLIHIYQQQFHINSRRTFYLPDPFPPYYEIVNPENSTEEEYIFCGGEAARDWDLVLAVANMMPDITYKIIARKFNWKNRKVPHNVEILFDVDETIFYGLVKKAKLVILPLKGKAPSGLIVLVRSILLGKLVLVTDTPSTIPYYPESCHDLLVPESDTHGFLIKIQEYFSNSKTRIKKTNELQQHIMTNYSSKAYTRHLTNIISNNLL